MTMLAMSASAAVAAEKDERRDAGAFVRALWAVKQFGTLEAADPRRDERTKALLVAALAKGGTITNRAVENKLMDPNTCQSLGSGSPETRRQLLPAVAAHLDALTTSFDRIDAVHLAAGEKLAEWIVSNYQPGKPLSIIFVCTCNSRRSVM